MFKPRTIDDIQIGFYKFLAEQGSALTDIAPGSVLYTLARSIAGVHAEQDIVLAEVSKSLNIPTASGVALDTLASNYRLTRKVGIYAEADVLVYPFEGDIVIQPNTVLTDQKTGLQFFINIDSPKSVFTFLEDKLPLKATATGREYNLPAGSRLLTNSYPGVRFVLGSSRTISGDVCGGITKSGASLESDDLFRTRIINFLINSRSTTTTAIKTILLSDPAVSWVSISTLLPGSFTAWVDSASPLSTAEFNRLATLVDLNKPAGIIADVKQVERQNLKFNLFVLPARDIDLDNLKTDIITIIQSYLIDLSFGQTMLRQEIIDRITATGKVIQVQMLEPLTDIVPITNSVLRGSDIWVTYDIL